MTARRKLIEQGWLIVMESSQWEMNRYGLRLAMEQNWSSRPLKLTRNACPPRESAGRTACPKANSTLLRRNRKLGIRREVDVRKRTKGCWPGPLRIEDLTNPERLTTVWRQLARRGRVPASEAGRLLVFATAARALRKARHNPCGLFYALLRDGCGGDISQSDEARGRQMLRGDVQSWVTASTQLASTLMELSGHATPLRPGDSKPRRSLRVSNHRPSIGGSARSRIF